MAKSLLDTDIFSEVLKSKNPTVVARANTYRQQYGRYTISALSVAEIVAGYQQAQRTAQLLAFRQAISTAEVLPVGTQEADLDGQIIGDLARTGQPIGVADPLIAAVAICNQLTLVTGNAGHFQRIQKLSYPLTLDDWR